MEQDNIATKIMNQAKEQYLLMAPCKCQWCNGKCIDCQYCGVNPIDFEGVSLYPIPSLSKVGILSPSLSKGVSLSSPSGDNKSTLDDTLKAIKDTLNEKFGKKVKCICIDCESKCDTTCKYCIHSLDEASVRLVVIEGSDLPKMRLNDSDSEEYDDSEDEVVKKELNKEFCKCVECPGCHEKRVLGEGITIGDDYELLFHGEKFPKCSEEVRTKLLKWIYSKDPENITDYDDYVNYVYYSRDLEQYRQGHDRYNKYIGNIQNLLYIPGLSQELYDDVKTIVDDATSIWWAAQMLKEWTDERHEKFSRYEKHLVRTIEHNANEYDNYRRSDEYNIYDYVRYLLYYSGSYREDYIGYRDFLIRCRDLMETPNLVEVHKQLLEDIIKEDKHIKKHIDKINSME